MLKFSVGPDELHEYDWQDIRNQENYQWVVYWYENGGYDGSGEMVALGNDGTLYYRNLGHCSCYGPCDGDLRKTTVEEFFKDKDDIWQKDWNQKIKDKVKELIG